MNLQACSMVTGLGMTASGLEYLRAGVGSDLQGGQQEASKHPCGRSFAGGCTPCVLLLCTCIAGPQASGSLAKAA